MSLMTGVVAERTAAPPVAGNRNLFVTHQGSARLAFCMHARVAH